MICAAALILQVGVPAGSAQTGQYLNTGSLTTITLNPGLYDITVYGAQGGASEFAGGLGAEMEAEFRFTTATTLTLLVGGAGVNNSYGGGGGGGGSFVVNGTRPLIIAGGGGGTPYDVVGSGGNGLTGSAGSVGNGGSMAGSGGTAGGGGGSGDTTGSGNGQSYGGAGAGGYSGNGGSAPPLFGGGGGQSFLSGGAGRPGSLYDPFQGYLGGGGYGGGGGGGLGGGGGGGGEWGGGGGGGSIIDSSAITVLAEVSGIVSPDDLTGNGEIIITAVPEPATLALAGLSGLCVLLFRRQRT